MPKPAPPLNAKPSASSKSTQPTESKPSGTSKPPAVAPGQPSDSPAIPGAKAATAEPPKPTDKAPTTTLGGTGGPPAAIRSPQVPTTAHSATFPKSWDDIQVGSVVLAP